MSVTIRMFERGDVPLKVRWINDPRNNRYLHYNLPLTEEGTYRWFEGIAGRDDRLDMTIELDGVPVGVIGLLSIDRVNRKAEYYVTLGEPAAAHRGVATKATRLLLDRAFRTMGLDRVYLYTERENLAAQRMFERVGFRREGLLEGDIVYAGRVVDRYVYGLSSDEYLGTRERTPVRHLGLLAGNDIYVKRDDLLPLSFGGNKARKAELFFREVDEGGHDCVVTYGTTHSNHCRVVASCCSARGIDCIIVEPKESSDPTPNSALVELCGARRVTVPVDEVHDTIERVLAGLRAEGGNPFFIPGGGHGNTGTQAYVDCYEEILLFERRTGRRFDEIYLASGTGTTQAGLVCGSLLHCEHRRIVGISIARTNPRGRDVVVDSVRDFLDAAGAVMDERAIQEAVIFDDSFVGSGYSSLSEDVDRTIRDAWVKHALALDRTYTGKAFHGMLRRLEAEGASGRRVLFLHTGGTPLFFGDLPEIMGNRNHA